jgi:exonuclease SbcC
MIDSLEIKNFQSHAETKLEFAPGTNTILGDTNSGKSAIIRALILLFQNRPLGDAYVSWGKKECAVGIATPSGKARRQRKPFNGYVIKDEKYKDIGTDVPPELAEVANLGPINFQTQFDPYFIVRETPGQISRYISELLALDQPDVAVAAARAQQSTLNRDVTRVNGEIETLQAGIDALNGLDEAAADVNRSEELIKTIELLGLAVSTLAQIKNSVLSIRTRLATARELHANLNLVPAHGVLQRLESLVTTQLTLNGLAASVRSARQAIQQTRAEGDRLRVEYDSLKARYVDELRTLKVCPFCWSNLSEEHLQEVLRQL